MYLILAIPALSALGSGHSSQSALELGKPIEGELAGGQSHSYQITLVEGQYAAVLVEQRGIDVVVRLLGVDGEMILAFNDEYRSEGEEKVDMVAQSTGRYELMVEAGSKIAPAASYRIRIAEIRPATEKDRLLHQARKLEADSNQASLAGKYEDARQRIERALAIGENVLGKEHPFVATLLYDLARYYDDKQQFASAIKLYERALDISAKTLGDEHPHTIVIGKSLAFVYYEANEIARAEPLAERVAEISQKTLGSEHPFVARCLHTLAQITRDLKKSEQLLQRALTVAEKAEGEDHPFVGNVLNDLGVLYTGRGDYQQAERFLLRAQAVYEKTLGPENISYVVSLHNLGIIARERKDYARAEENYRKAIAIVEKAFGPENPRLAIILNNIANIYRARGEYAKSLEAHLRVLRISEKTRGPYHPLTLLSLGNIAKTYAARGDIAEAIKFQSRVDSVIERNIEMNLAIGSERQKLSYLNGVAERTDRTISLNVDLAPGDPTASALAALVLLQRKGRVLDAMSESFASLRQRSTPEEQSIIERYNETTSQLARLVLNGPQQLSFEEHQKTVGDLEERKERLESEISRRSAEFRAGSQAVTLAAVQAAIPADAALIEMAVYRPFDPKAESNSEAYGEPRYIAYVLRQTGEIRWLDLGEAGAIDQSIGLLREALGDPSRRDARERARALDEKVMRQVRALAGDASQLLISPDGALNLIPFEALVDEKGRYLIERYSFTYLTSGRDLMRLQVARAGHSSSLVIADPFFGEPLSTARPDGLSARSRAGKREGIRNATDLSSVYFAPLAGTAQEARAIKSLFPEVNALVGRQATESSLKRSEAPRLLHIATHGFFLTPAGAKIENPLLRSGLALAGANLRKGSEDDGILTAMEASGLNLWGTKLVTLSACDTGLGEVKYGEGVYGLRRAFVLAGAESLVMSLWPVSDYVTREMMTAYYKSLKQGLGRGESLRQVQLSMLRRRDRQHPFYWASFIQAGEWASLDGRR
jgi:CHAT domain-containing protein/Tfp pilus assembly protein PilF